jgi:hypothetical protein
MPLSSFAGLTEQVSETKNSEKLKVDDTVSVKPGFLLPSKFYKFFNAMEYNY